MRCLAGVCGGAGGPDESAHETINWYIGNFLAWAYKKSYFSIKGWRFATDNVRDGMEANVTAVARRVGFFCRPRRGETRMGMANSLWTGANGLHTYQSAITALSDNVANLTSVGYKKLDTTFTDLLYSTLRPAATANGNYGTTNTDAVGNGVTTASQSYNFTQGPLNATGGELDFAIEGDGFFIVSDRNGGEYLTRAGDFYVGATANDGTVDLLAGNGMHIKGFVASSGDLSNKMTDITLPAIGSTVDGRVSTKVEIAGNLDSNGDVVASNIVTEADGWVDSQGRKVNGINIGGVQSSAVLRRVSVPTAPVTGNTLLTDLEFQATSTIAEKLFRDIPAGSTVNSREIMVRFEKNGVYYEKTMTVGAESTLADFSTWLCGALGDDSSGGRTNGGALGTVYVPSYSQYSTPAEQAGGYLSYEDDGAHFNVACNVGAANFISDVTVTVTTSITTAEGKDQNMVDKFNPLFDENRHFPNGLGVPSPSTNYAKAVVDKSLQDMKLETQSLSFVKVATDNNGSTWRWYVNDPADAGNASVNQGTGIVRFDTTGKMIYSKDDGDASLAYDFRSLTQMGASDSISATTDGYLQGSLQSYMHADDGVIMGVYDNGYSFVLAQLGMAVVPNAVGLTGVGGTLFQANNVSGMPIYNAPGGLPNYFGNIAGGYLEESNYELGAEAIIIQRAYQMSSRLVTVTDEMLQTAISLKKD